MNTTTPDGGGAGAPSPVTLAEVVGRIGEWNTLDDYDIPELGAGTTLTLSRTGEDTVTAVVTVKVDFADLAEKAMTAFGLEPGHEPARRAWASGHTQEIGEYLRRRYGARLLPDGDRLVFGPLTLLASLMTDQLAEKVLADTALTRFHTDHAEAPGRLGDRIAPDADDPEPEGPYTLAEEIGPIGSEASFDDHDIPELGPNTSLDLTRTGEDTVSAVVTIEVDLEELAGPAMTTAGITTSDEHARTAWVSGHTHHIGAYLQREYGARLTTDQGARLVFGPFDLPPGLMTDNLVEKVLAATSLSRFHANHTAAPGPLADPTPLQTTIATLTAPSKRLDGVDVEVGLDEIAMRLTAALAARGRELAEAVVALGANSHWESDAVEILAEPIQRAAADAGLPPFGSIGPGGVHHAFYGRIAHAAGIDTDYHPDPDQDPDQDPDVADAPGVGPSPSPAPEGRHGPGAPKAGGLPSPGLRAGGTPAPGAPAGPHLHGPGM